MKIAVHCLRIALALLLPSASWATQIIGGDIHYEHISGLTYRITVNHYTKLSASPDAPEAVIHFGDGTQDTVPLTGFIDHFSIDLRRSTFQAEHQYPGPGIYTIICDDQNRAGGIVNVPNSISQTFCLPAVLIISPIVGENNSVHFLEPTLTYVFTAGMIIHDPVPIEPDGDSLSFDLVVPHSYACDPIIGYQFPPGSWVDPVTGVFHWPSPSLMGIWTIAIRAREWREGLFLGEVVRDMIINVLPQYLNVAEWTMNDQPWAWPVPTNGLLWVEGDPISASQVILLDATGRVVLVAPHGGQPTPLDLGHLAPGAYLLRQERQDGHMRTTRVVRE